MQNIVVAASQAGRALKRLLAGFALLSALQFATRPAQAQSVTEGGSDRKLITRVEPTYPETLKRLYIGGAVRIEVMVGASGNVESTELLGGNPVLGQSAMKAIKQWKYAPSKASAKLVVRMEFDPHE
jgi:protein TonB